MLRIPLFFLLGCLLLLAGCAHQLPPASSPLRSLERKSIPEVKEQPYFRFSWAKRTFRVAHGAWKIPEENPGWNQMYGWGPVVWVTEGLNTRVLDLRKDFPSSYVSNVFQDEGSGRIYLFLDYGIEGPAAVYHVWISEDGGERWFAGADLRRPPGTYPPAELDRFYLGTDGAGSAWFRIEAASLPSTDRAGLPARAVLFYSAATRDGGRSWQYGTKPEFSSVLQQEEERHQNP
jgi:hypothetical protein